MTQLPFFFLLLAFYLSFPADSFGQSKPDSLQLILTNEQEKQANEILDSWEKKEFSAFLQRQKIKLSCAHCERIKLEVEFRVLEEHAHFKITSGIKCGENFTKKQLKELELLLMKIGFPGSFNGKIIRRRFGNALKC